MKHSTIFNTQFWQSVCEYLYTTYHFYNTEKLKIAHAFGVTLYVDFGHHDKLRHKRCATCYVHKEKQKTIAFQNTKKYTQKEQEHQTA